MPPDGPRTTGTQGAANGRAGSPALARRVVHSVVTQLPLAVSEQRGGTSHHSRAVRGLQLRRSRRLSQRQCSRVAASRSAQLDAADTFLSQLKAQELSQHDKRGLHDRAGTAGCFRARGGSVRSGRFELSHHRGH
eukprot:5123508-Prymnesium_polylepis.1